MADQTTDDRDLDALTGDTREALLKLIESHAQRGANVTSTESLARAYALVITAKPGEPSTMFSLP